MPIAVRGSHRTTGHTITEQFHAFDAHPPRTSTARSNAWPLAVLLPVPPASA